jgi:hypothetical protein
MTTGIQFSQDIAITRIASRGYFDRRPDQAFAAVHFRYGGVKTPFSRASFQINVTRHGHGSQNSQDDQDRNNLDQGKAFLIAQWILFFHGGCLAQFCSVGLLILTVFSAQIKAVYFEHLHRCFEAFIECTYDAKI